MADEKQKALEIGGATDERAETSGDKATRLGSSHGEQGKWVEKSGYAHDINAMRSPGGSGREARGGASHSSRHPSRNLSARAKGFGIGGGYERPYRKVKPKPADTSSEMYGPLPPGGYYGTGTGARPFERGQARYDDELAWYGAQYGENTSGYVKRKK
jgi:hypothetical protein